MEELAEDPLNEPSASHEEHFCIDNEERANWLLRKLANLDAEKARVKAQAADILQSLTAEENRLRARFETELIEWAQREITRRGGKGKSLKLLQGTCAFRTVPAGVRVVSPAEAIDYARAQGWDMIRTVESLDADAYKREALTALLTTGEALPGVEGVPERESFSVKFLPGRATGQGDAEPGSPADG